MRLYEKVSKARFLSRPNRFIAHCQLPNDEIVKVHVANTGRCQELLIPGAKVILAWVKPDSKRKTPATLVAVEREDQLINIDSQAPNRLVWAKLNEGLVFPGIEGPYEDLKKEVTLEQSRIDFSFLDAKGKRVWLEVKGVTLKVGETALFPDAPTERGLRHLEKLSSLVPEDRVIIFFVIQMQGVEKFSPNYVTQPAFAESLKRAWQRGVKVLAWQCQVYPEGMDFLKKGHDIEITF